METTPILRALGALLLVFVLSAGRLWAASPFAGTYRGSLYNTNSAGENVWLGISRVEFTVEPDGTFKITDQFKGTVADSGTVTFDQPGVGVTTGQVTGTRMTASQTTGAGSESFTIRFEADRFGDLLPTWTDVEPTLGLPANHGWINVVAGNGKFVARTTPVATTAGWTALLSTDGRAWTRHPIDLGVGASDRTYGYPVYFANGRFWFSVCGDNLGGPNTRIYSSTDGIAWSVVDLGVKYGGVIGLAHGGGRYVALLERNGQADVRVLTSTDGASWALSTVGPASFNPVRLAYANGRFVIGQDRNRSHVSLDGLTWRDVAFPDVQFGALELAGNNGRFVAAASGVVVSADGESWHAPSPGPGANFRALGAGEGFFYAQPTVNGVPLYRSTDGERWRKVVRTPPSGTFYFVEQIAVLGNVVVAGAQQSLLVAELGAGEGHDVVLPPLILKQPSPLTRNLRAGDNADLSADVETGGGLTTLQWTRDGVPVPGATNRSVSFFPVLTSHAGTWVLTVSNALGVVTTTPVVVNVTDPKIKPTIQFQPAAQSVAAGGNAAFGVFAQGSPLLSYQWRKDDVNLPGQTGLGLQVAYVVPSDAGDYTVVVSNPYGSITSSVAKLTVTGGPVAPRIVTEPASLTVTAGGTGALTVVAKGTDPLTYQWKKGANNVPNGTGATLNFNPASLADAGTYTVTVSNGQGSVTSTAVTVTVKEPVAPPQITQQPNSTGVYYDDAPLACNELSGTPIEKLRGARVVATIGSGADPFVSSGSFVVELAPTGGTYTIAANGNVPAASGTWTFGRDLGIPTVLFLNNYFANGATAKMVILANCNYELYTDGQVGSQGGVVELQGGATNPPPQNATFTVAATGTGLTYQWFKDGTAIAGATAATLTVPNVTLADFGGYTVRVTNDGGSVTSDGAMLFVSNSTTQSPQLVRAIGNRSVPLGGTTTFTAELTGTGPMRIQWLKDGVALPGKTGLTLTLDNVQAADAGTYRLRIVSPAGTFLHGNAVLTIAAPAVPTITAQPQSKSVFTGANVTFSVTATGTAPLAYQWRKNGENISGATAASLTLNNVALTDAGDFTVVVSNAQGTATSEVAKLTVNPAPVAPTITQPPVAQTVVVGANVVFSVTATGTAPLTYQWRKDGEAVPGATAATLNLANVSAAAAGDYLVVVGNEAGNVTSAVARLTVNVPPAIAVQPLSRTVTVGSAATFTVQATGTAPLAFQWRKNGNPITGATAASYTINSAALTDAGDFTVVISNVAGSVTSSVAKLIVETAPVAPSIVTQPVAREILRGSAAEMSVAATGTGPLTYQWYRGAAGDLTNPFEGATDFAVNLAGLAADTSVWVRVSNAVGHADSAAVTITVVPLRLVASGRSLGVPPGGTATLEVVANSDVPLTYQWYRGAPGDTAAPLAGANAASFVTPPVNEPGAYWVRVANEFGFRDSTAYTVTPAAFEEIPETPMTQESLSPVSGLYTRTVTVRNLTAGTLPGFTLLVDTGSPDVDVWNASGSAGGRFQIAWPLALAAGEAVNLVVEFYSRVRPWTGTPRFEVSPEVVPGPPLPNGTPFAVDRVVPLDSGALLIEFTATPGRRYFIEYSDNLAAWVRSRLGVTAGGTRVQWVDSGPPKTYPAPNGENQRYYRVIAAPTAN